MYVCIYTCIYVVFFFSFNEASEHHQSPIYMYAYFYMYHVCMYVYICIYMTCFPLWKRRRSISLLRMYAYVYMFVFEKEIFLKGSEHHQSPICMYMYICMHVCMYVYVYKWRFFFSDAADTRTGRCAFYFFCTSHDRHERTHSIVSTRTHSIVVREHIFLNVRYIIDLLFLTPVVLQKKL